jgi:hypothetical protein
MREYRKMLKAFLANKCACNEEAGIWCEKHYFSMYDDVPAVESAPCPPRRATAGKKRKAR